MTAPRTVARSRVGAALLAVLLVTLAAIAYRVSDPVSENELVRAPLDRSVRFAEGTVRVSDVRMAKTLEKRDQTLTSQGAFVVVTVTVQAPGREQVRVADNRLVTPDGTTYESDYLLDGNLTAEAGFETSGDLVFEVDPQRAAGLVLELWSKGPTFRYYERLQTPLGITAENAGAWTEAAEGRSIVLTSESVTKGLA